ncbi:MAG: CoA-binding protein [Humidesulfovibrio sp.]|uniref:CoA-binding protein n=1 Tax=Humidesulfovibrio sp. TaxID=2910988 RepID=UPI0027FDEBB2|nr:CoA-binding protein [Humidesulfovibrio sp.]MDQ7835929.1 CoA-binding protein [Humidesulfovibrio sp.]
MLHSAKELAALLGKVKTIAVIGAKDKPGQPVDKVGRYLLEAGFRVIPVHPKRAEVWGLKAYPTINDIPEPVDLVDLFRAADFCPAHAEEFLRLSPLPKCFWMQSGIVSQQARAILSGHPVLVVEDRCLMVDHRNLVSSGTTNV